MKLLVHIYTAQFVWPYSGCQQLGLNINFFIVENRHHGSLFECSILLTCKLFPEKQASMLAPNLILFFLVLNHKFIAGEAYGGTFSGIYIHSGY